MLNCIDNDDDSKNERVIGYNHYIQEISLLNMIMMLNCIDNHDDRIFLYLGIIISLKRCNY